MALGPHREPQAEAPAHASLVCGQRKEAAPRYQGTQHPARGGDQGGQSPWQPCLCSSDFSGSKIQLSALLVFY